MISIHNVYGGESPTPLTLKTFSFPGGEPHAVVEPKEITGQYVWIEAHVANPTIWMQLLAVLDAVKRCRPARLGLFIPYFPGCQQDRCDPKGTPLTVKIYADIINSFGCDVVVVADPHSDVLPALLNNCAVISAADILFANSEQYSKENEGGKLHTKVLGTEYVGLICPDAGALKRTTKVAERLGIKTIIQAHKVRDTKTGELSGARIDPIIYNGNYLIVDDICVGGLTFVNIMKAIQNDPEKLNAPNINVDLYVTHGIFSNGMRDLSIFNRVLSTNSWNGDTWNSLTWHGKPWNGIDLWPKARGIMLRTIGK